MTAAINMTGETMNGGVGVAGGTAGRDGSTQYRADISLEVHVELKTRTKIFCDCPNSFGAPPNTNVCPVCLGLPGSLPVLNRAALALNCTISPETVFARKNYFYPDLPKGYQISQSDKPVGTNGWVEIEGEGGANGSANGGAGAKKRIRIRRVHLEEDAGKSFHGAAAAAIGTATGAEDTSGDTASASGLPGSSGTSVPSPDAEADTGVAPAPEASPAGPGSDYSLLDFNRCGVPLIEIVSEIDLTSGEEARAYLQKLRTILSYTDVSDLKIEEGSLRCDANVSIRPVSSAELGVRSEVKNIGSFRGVKMALEYEIARQREVLESGKRPTLDTRRWDEKRARTTLLRSKEEANDYRYFPEPDLVPTYIDEAFVAEVRRGLPELPDAKLARLVAEDDLAPYNADVIASSPALAAFYEKGAAKVAQGATPAKVDAKRTFSNWVIGDFLSRLNAAGKSIEESPVTPEGLAGLVNLIGQGTISGKIAKDVFEEMFATGKAAEAIVKEKGLAQITDSGAIAAVVDQVIAANPGPVADFKAGKDRAIGFLVGQVMKLTKGQASPELVNKLLREKLV